MARFRGIVFTALIGGLIAGFVLTAIQTFKVSPLIFQAEVYEQSSPGAASDEHQPWAPEDGIERWAYTLLFNVLTGIAFALLLTAAFALKGGIDWRRGLLWGLAGYAVFNLAPAFGLPPELPGAQAAELETRQIWWAGTVLATAVGLWLVAFAGQTWMRLAGAMIVALPHVVGAPHLEFVSGSLPAELAAAFVSASLVANLLFWLAIGGVSGYAYRRIAET